MNKEQANLERIKEFLKEAGNQGDQITVKQVAKALNMPVAEAAEAIQRLEFTADADDLK